MIAHLPIEADEDYLRFSFFGAPCRVSRKSGLAECREKRSEAFREADFDEALTVFDLLCNSRRGAAPCGEFVDTGSLTPLHSASHGTLTAGLFPLEALEFDRAPNALRAALCSLGARFVPGGDLSAEVPFFGEWKLLFRFWHSDEEFEAKIQCMWDREILSLIRYETVWYANSAFMRRLKECLNAL